MKHGVSVCLFPSLFHLSPLPHRNLYMYYNLKIELPFKPRSRIFMPKSKNGRLDDFLIIVHLCYIMEVYY